MLKESVGRDGWQCVLIVAVHVVNFVGFKTSISRQKLPALSGFDVKFAYEEMLHFFYRLQNIEDLSSQRNVAAEWSSNFSTVSTCKTSRTELNRSETSGSVS